MHERIASVMTLQRKKIKDNTKENISNVGSKAAILKLKNILIVLAVKVYWCKGYF